MIDFANLQEEFQLYIQDNIFKQEPLELYAPVNYILSLGGKRIRPLLLLISYQLFEEDFEKALPAAMSIEIFHNFSLVHDDIMDAADLRRGQVAVHKKYGLNDAILSGDVMLIYAYQFLAKTENQYLLPRMIQLFNENAIKVCEGQQMDVNFETREDVSIMEYLTMIEYKTAVLLGLAMQLGAVIAGRGEDDQKHLYDFARYLGIAFQLQDDILDTYGDPVKFGKKVGGDIIQNKKTFLYLKTRERADEKDLSLLLELYAENELMDSEKVEQVKELYNKYNVREMAIVLMNDYKDKAFSCLDLVKANRTKKDALKKYAQQIIDREF